MEIKELEYKLGFYAKLVREYAKLPNNKARKKIAENLSNCLMEKEILEYYICIKQLSLKQQGQMKNYRKIP
jgi:hypothetical protein